MLCVVFLFILSFRVTICIIVASTNSATSPVFKELLPYLMVFTLVVRYHSLSFK